MRWAANVSHFSLLASSNLQPELAIDASHTMFPGVDMLSSQQDQKTAPTPARPLRSQVGKTHFQKLIVLRFPAIAQVAASKTDELAGSKRAETPRT